MSPRDRRQFERLEQIFYAALDIEDIAERERYVTAIRAEDPATGEQLRSLLENHREVVAASSSQPSERAPRFGAWQSIRVLGRGGMGSVYLAERADGAFQMTAAVKVVPLAMASQDIEERFLKERQFLAMLNHPGISRLIDGGVSDLGLPFLVMEFVDGEPIDRYSDRHSLSLRDRVELMRQALQALAYVHSRRLLHRDLKPSNIMVDASGRVKLVDFGIARVMSADLTSPSLALTPEYASPEQKSGGALGESSDIYSAGVVLHKLIAGIHDANLEAVVNRATAADPKHRYQSALEMDADLERYLTGERIPSAKQSRSAWIGLPAVVAVLASWFALRPQPIPTVAVLPFVNAGGNEDRYFSDGVSDDVRTMLERAKPLLVIARASSLPFRNPKLEIKELGKQLHATALVAGTVSHANGRVTINARLERTSDGSTLWEKTYERAESDLSSLETDVARDVAASLHAVMTAAKHAVTNQEAIHLLMRARFEAEQFTEESFANAERDLRRAIEIDSQYAAAYATLGATVINRGSGIHDLEGHRKIVAEGTAFYRKALELDPALVVPRVNLAGFMLQDAWDWKGAEEQYRAALANGPNATANALYGYMLAEQGRFAEADEHFKAAEEQNPYAASQMINIANARIFERRYADALAIDQLMVARSMNAAGARQNVNWIHVLQGHADLALADYDQHPDASPLAKMQRAQALAFLGRRDEAVALIQQMESDYRKFMPATSFAVVYARFDPPQAIEWLNKAADDHDFALLSIGVSEAFDPIRKAPGFQAILKRIGLAK